MHFEGIDSSTPLTAQVVLFFARYPGSTVQDLLVFFEDSNINPARLPVVTLYAYRRGIMRRKKQTECSANTGRNNAYRYWVNRRVPNLTAHLKKIYELIPADWNLSKHCAPPHKPKSNATKQDKTNLSLTNSEKITKYIEAHPGATYTELCAASKTIGVHATQIGTAPS